MRILSFGHYLQGPAATQYLTDMRAEAVKVEPLGGAFEREPLAPDLLPEGRSALFLAANRNQRSLANWYHPAPYGVYTLADDVVALSIVTAEQLCAALKRPVLDPLKALAPYRDRDRFARRLAGVLATLSYQEVSAAFTEHGIWIARVSGYDALERHPQIAANQTVAEIALAAGALNSRRFRT